MLTSQNAHRAALDREPLNWNWSGIAQDATDILKALPHPRHYLILADDTAQSTDGPRHWVCLTEDELWTGITQRACSAVQACDGGTRRTCAAMNVLLRREAVGKRGGYCMTWCVVRWYTTDNTTQHAFCQP